MVAKAQLGDTLIFEPSGRIHFVNQVKNDYYWCARTEMRPYKLVKDDHSDYFGFKEGDNDLFYFHHQSGHNKMINCDLLKSELATINAGRKKGDKFNCAEPIETTFWLRHSDGEVGSNAKEVATSEYDMFEIHQKSYHIWHDNTEKMDVRFWRIEKCIGPCVCKCIHVEADYVQEEVEKHRALRNGYQFALQFRDYVDLVNFEFSCHDLPVLEKEGLVVYTNRVLAPNLYKGLFQSHLNVVAKEIDDDYDLQHLVLRDLFKITGIKHLVHFFGMYVFEDRCYLVFEGFELIDRNVELGLSKDDLLLNLKGLIGGVAYMQELPFLGDMWGNISASSVVITGADLGQSRLKIFIPGLGVEGRTKKNDRKGLAEIINRFTRDFQIPEFHDLVRNLRRNDWYELKSLIKHPIFWTAFEKLDFFCSVYEVVRDDRRLRSALSNIKQAVENSQTGIIDYEFFCAMESYSTYAQGLYCSKVGQLVRMIHHSKIHDLDLPKEVRELYGKSRKGLEKYFSDRYPNLFFELYKLVQKICPKHDHFAQFTILEQ